MTKYLLLLLLLGVLFYRLGHWFPAWLRDPRTVRRTFPLAAAVLLGAPLLCRLLLLPWWPVPLPMIHDEFVYLFAADRYQSGHIQLPADPDAPFFEVLYILQDPTIAPKYPQLPGLLLALGQALTGEPWVGVWLSCGAMNFAIAWFLLPWTGRRGALVSLLLVGGYLGLSGYWMNSYWGGATSATMAALLLGAWTRLCRRASVGMGILFSLAWVGSLAARPYEGALLLGLPLAIHLTYRLWRPQRIVLAAIVLTAASGGAAISAYNNAITGSPWRMPYLAYSERYHYAPIFWFQPLRPKPVYSKPAIRITMELEEKRYHALRSEGGWRVRWEQWRTTFFNLAPGIAYVLPLAFLPLVLRRGRYWIPAALLCVGVAGCSLTVFHFAHYFAPFAPLLFLFLVAAWRQASAYRWGPAWAAAYFVTVLCADVFVARAKVVSPLPPHPITLRKEIERVLSQRDSQHVIFVRDRSVIPDGEATPDWTYNRANLDQAEVVWANDLGDDRNEHLLRRFPGREYWRMDWPASALVLTPLHPRPGQEALTWVIRRVD